MLHHSRILHKRHSVPRLRGRNGDCSVSVPTEDMLNAFGFRCAVPGGFDVCHPMGGFWYVLSQWGGIGPRIMNSVVFLSRFCVIHGDGLAVLDLWG